jgi:hypothetical protein
MIAKIWLDLNRSWCTIDVPEKISTHVGDISALRKYVGFFRYSYTSHVSAAFCALALQDLLAFVSSSIAIGWNAPAECHFDH